MRILESLGASGKPPDRRLHEINAGNDTYFINFADASARLSPEAALIYRMVGEGDRNPAVRLRCRTAGFLLLCGVL